MVSVKTLNNSDANSGGVTGTDLPVSKRTAVPRITKQIAKNNVRKYPILKSLTAVSALNSSAFNFLFSHTHFENKTAPFVGIGIHPATAITKRDNSIFISISAKTDLPSDPKLGNANTNATRVSKEKIATRKRTIFSAFEY